MKALSIKQPWASLIAEGIKDIENRTWRTNYRGRILVHTGASKVDFNTWYDSPLSNNQLLALPDNWSTCQFEYTAIIGSVEIVDCVQNHKSIWAEIDCWHWVLNDPVLFPQPILNVKGKLSFWEWPGEIPIDVHSKSQEV